MLPGRWRTSTMKATLEMNPLEKAVNRRGEEMVD